MCGFGSDRSKSARNKVLTCRGMAQAFGVAESAITSRLMAMRADCGRIVSLSIASRSINLDIGVTFQELRETYVVAQ
jgi:hypothetical protein